MGGCGNGCGLLLTPRLHYGIQAYQELLLHVQQMLLSQNEELVKSARVLLSNVVYHMEYCDIVVRMLRTYNQVIQPRDLLHDIVTLSSLHLKLMKQYSGKGGSVIVQRKRKIHKPRPKPAGDDVMTEEQVLGVWASVLAEVELAMADDDLSRDDVVPFDATCTSDEDQKYSSRYR